MEQKEYLIQCRDLAFAYEGITAVRGLSFKVEAGDHLCIVGENGAGKSTLIKGLLGLIKPASGSITLEHGLLAREIGYLPQQSAVQKDFPASVWEVVLSGCLNQMQGKPFYTKREKLTAGSAMQRMGIEPLKNRCYRELSGGQQQRVLLARALCAATKLILLDEPAAGLDPVATQELYSLIDRLNRELGITVIVVSHDVAAAVSHAKHILHLCREQLFYGTAAEYERSEIGQRFLGGASHA